MLRSILISSVLLLGFTGLLNSHAFGDFDATLWAPDEILLKERYYGTIILGEKFTEDKTFEVITDNEEVLKLVSKSVTVPAGKHHGLIEFETIGAGDAGIFAISQDVLLEERVNVVVSADTPTDLELILPSDLVNVLADENIHTGYVFLLNDFGNPVSTKQEILVDLTSNGEINLPKKSVTISPGTHYAKFPFVAKGEGSISASAQNLSPDEETITLDDLDTIELMIRVAPDPIPTDSTGEIFYWLERDGKPYLPPHDVRISISIDKSSNLSFNPAMRGAIVLTPDTSDRQTVDPDAREIVTRTEVQLGEDSRKTVVLKEGSHYGRLTAYSTFDSTGDITISGLAESIDPGSDEETIRVTDVFSTSTESSNHEMTTETEVFAFPDPAYDQLEVIVSSLSDQGPVIEDNDESFTLFTDNKIRAEKNQETIKTDRNYEIIRANVLEYGSSVLFAERNESESDELTIETAGKYVKNPELSIVTLPVLFGTEQDLFLVSSSQEKIITKADEEGNLVSITSRPSFDFEVIQESESVITISGKISELLDTDPEIHIASNAFTAQGTLEVYNPNRKMLGSFHPLVVYPDEVFPIITHIEDLNSNPVRKSPLRVSSIADMGNTNELFFFNQTGRHDIIFFEENAVPIKSTISVNGAPIRETVRVEEDNTPTIITYDIVVNDGQGSGEYAEDEEVTISAAPSRNDLILFKEKLVGWENLPYTEPEVTFRADEDIQTRPIYQEDFSLLFVTVVSIGGIGAFVAVRKKRNGKKQPQKEEEEDEILELLKD